MGLLPAALGPLSARTANARSVVDSQNIRRGALIGSLIAFLVALAPPLYFAAHRFEYLEALQFALLAVVVPSLLVSGAPWRKSEGPRWRRRLIGNVKRDPALWRAVLWLLLNGAVIIVWRTPWAVNALVQYPSLLALESVTLIGTGVLAWRELIESPPFTPRLERPHRLAAATVIMWEIWVLAYLVGLSHASWFHGYVHAPGVGFSVSADQQLSAVVLWFISGAAFMPVVFWNLFHWLSSEERPEVSRTPSSPNVAMAEEPSN